MDQSVGLLSVTGVRQSGLSFSKIFAEFVFLLF